MVHAFVVQNLSTTPILSNVFQSKGRLIICQAIVSHGMAGGVENVSGLLLDDSPVVDYLKKIKINPFI